MARFFLVLAVLVIPSFVRAQELTEPAKKVSFDLLKTQHMVVEVKLNGKGPFRLIFDTGAPVTLINNKLAKAAGVIPKDFKRPLFAPFGSVGQFTIDLFELGDIKSEKIPTVVMDHPTVELISKVMGPIDGIVGMSFFGRYRMSIDYQAKQMTFVPNQFELPDIMDRMMKSMLEPRGKQKAVVLRASGVCGFTVDKASDDTAAGVVVKTVYAGSPADTAGLKAGDRLLVLDDRWTDSVEDCHVAATYLKAGSAAVAVVEREKKRLELTIRVKAGL